MQKLILFVIAIFVLASCQKERDQVEVDYYITGFADTCTVSYLEADGTTKTETFKLNGINDKWVHTFLADPGTPLYLYFKMDPQYEISFMNFNMAIMIDGKYYQQAKNYDRPLLVGTDTVAFEIKRSGTVPF